MKIAPSGRVMFSVLGTVSTWVTFKAISRGFIRIGGVEHTQAEGPVDFWFVIAVMTYLTVLCFLGALVKGKDR